MLPRPAATTLNLDPGAKSDLTLGNLDAFLFAHRVLATGAVVGRNFYAKCKQSNIQPAEESIPMRYCGILATVMKMTNDNSRQERVAVDTGPTGRGTKVLLAGR